MSIKICVTNVNDVDIIHKILKRNDRLDPNSLRYKCAENLRQFINEIDWITQKFPVTIICNDRDWFISHFEGPGFEYSFNLDTYQERIDTYHQKIKFNMIESNNFNLD